MSSLPTGTVTFLFTDIEGSTKLWQQYPDAMPGALARHHAILNETIAAHGGYVFQIVGDAFCAAFPTATDGLAAALAAQRALRHEVWGETGPIRVRMGLHTGSGDVRLDDLKSGQYVSSLTLSRVARLLSVGHGGQVLASLATQALARDQLADGVTLRDLGKHRLKDLAQPEHIFQLVAPGLPADFPPLKTLDARPNNLPVQPTPLIGREKQIAAIRRLLEGGARLVTLTGPGGTGKTRLGLQVAAELGNGFEDGVYFVNLAPLSDSNLVASAIAQTLGVRESGGQSVAESLKEYVRGKRLLLLLDSFEQLIAAAPLVADLLAVSLSLQVLVTSRERLHLRGEHEFPVPPLALPDPNRLPPVEQLPQYAAVELFLQCALAVKPGFAITNQNAPAVAEICVRLDGLPLAIELAAARCKLLSPQAIRARLGRRLTLLTSGARDLPARHQTLRDAMAWSHDLLDEKDKVLFRRLSVFASSFELPAVEPVCYTPDLEGDVLDRLASLVDKSLLRKVEETDAEPRFAMLETIREYASEQLEQSGERETLRRKQAQYYLALTERAEPQLKGADQTVWLERLEQELGNIRTVLQWAEQTGEVETGLRIAAALNRFWHVRGYLSEGRDWLEKYVALTASAGADLAAVRANALGGLGMLVLYQCDYAQARSLHQQALALRRELGDKPGIAACLNNLGFVVQRQCEYELAAAFYEESLGLKRELGDKRGAASSLNNLGYVARLQGNYEQAIAYLEESLALFREVGSTPDLALPLTNLGVVARYKGDYARAARLYQESLALKREQGDKGSIAVLLNNLGEVSALQGDYQRATELLEESLSVSRELGDRWLTAQTLHTLGGVAESQGDVGRAAALYAKSLTLRRELRDKEGITDCLQALGSVACARNQAERAARLLGAAEALRETIGAPWTPDDRAQHDRNVVALRVRLATFAEEWARGRAMTMEQAVAYALEET